MEVLGSRILLHPTDPVASRAFYRDLLGLAVHREFGPAEAPGTVFFLGGGYLEVSGSADAGQGDAGPPHRARLELWLQVRDVDAEIAALSGRGVEVLRPPRTEPWGLREAWIADPDGTRIVLVQVPADHPLRRDRREPA